MNKFFPIVLAMCAFIASCKQSSKPATATTAASDTITYIEDRSVTDNIMCDAGAADTVTYIEGYIFTNNVMCEAVSETDNVMSDENSKADSIPAGFFCLDNYEFPATDYYSCMIDSNDVLYYCPGTQDELYFKGYLTKEKFAMNTRHVRGCSVAPESWQKGKEYTFSCKAIDEKIKFRKVRINDPDAVLVQRDGTKESLYGKYIYSINSAFESLFYKEIIVASYDYDQLLTVSDSGYFSIVDNETHQAKPTSAVLPCPDIPEFSNLYFVEDSIIIIDHLVYYME